MCKQNPTIAQVEMRLEVFVCNENNLEGKSGLATLQPVGEITKNYNAQRNFWLTNNDKKRTTRKSF
jgi:hypothetical protein